MNLGDTTRFILLTLGTFFLLLGGAALLFSLVEQLFFDLRGIGFIVSISFVNLVLGLLLLLVQRRHTL